MSVMSRQVVEYWRVTNMFILSAAPDRGNSPCVLVARAALDYEAAREHRLVLRATDGVTGAYADAALTVSVLDANDCAPAFPQDLYRAAVSEAAPPGTLVLALIAADNDTGDNGRVTYSLSEMGSAAEGAFAIDPDTGAVRVAAPLDRETRAQYHLLVTATDGGRPALLTTAHLFVTVEDVNDSPPRMERGVVPALLDRESASEHIIGIIAEGEGSPAPATMVTTCLHVLDVNEHAPSFHSQPYVVHVAENTPPHSSLVQLMADDPDVGSNGEVRYSLAPDGEGAEAASALFAVDPYTGWVSTLAPLDRELTPAYDLVLAASDGKFTAQTDLHIDVLDVNDNPPYCLRHRYWARLPEDAANGTLVMRLETGDADAPGAAGLRYYLSGDAAHHFSIARDSGEVRVAAPLDRERRAEYRLRAHAQDRERADWECSSELRVALADVNDNAPAFSAPLYSVTLPEDADLGTLVAKVHATDPDLGENRLVRYSFVEEPSGAFELAADSGIVTLRAPLDRETQAEHRLLLRATDAGSPPRSATATQGLRLHMLAVQELPLSCYRHQLHLRRCDVLRSATATLRLTVADVNDNPPEFEFHQYRAAVPELDAPGTQVLRVRATSRDAGVNADVYYSLVGGDDRDDFAVDRASGVVSVARPLDYERRQQYLLTVQAVDGGTPPLSDLATLNITVGDGNDNAPQFAQAAYSARVREDAAPGTRVLQLVADDADSGANGRVTYSVARGDRDGRFALDADTGYLSVAAPLDREAAPAHVLTVRARDHGLPALEASVSVNIEVLDANDNPPLFAQSNYTAVVQEDRPLGHTILKFVVEDADAPPNGAPYTFDFQSGNEMGAFRLEQDGYLRSATRFNHRIKDRYVLQIRVFDNGTPPLYSDAWVYIRVIEESQYPPVVTPLEVVVNSYLDEFPGGIIGRVFASDRDAYDTLSYSIVPIDGAPYPPTDLFEIDPADGTLKAAPRLDVGEYRLNVTVDDGKFLGFAIIKVSVILISDEMLAQTIVVRFREVTDRDFILSHRKGFIRAIGEATDCEPGDVVIVSVQPAGESAEADELGPGRPRRQVAQDLDVAVARVAGARRRPRPRDCGVHADVPRGLLALARPSTDYLYLFL
ncbi:hypothetical protein B5X24_HaOG215400 [Helicoverpa armigera]|nr:hypothetical protein B5X24_HaOG215400 [Helicoverpa armigera]